MTGTREEWGRCTPESVKIAVGSNTALIKAINECLSEQGHPDDWDLFPLCCEILSSLSPVEIDALVAQGHL